MELIRYQKNSRVLAPIKSDMDGIFSTGSINLLITEELIKQIQATSLTIFEKQQTAIIQEANQQQRIVYDVPFFDQEKGEQQIRQLPVYYFGSSARGSECGFFSLGFQGREQAISQIVDNLVENNIYVLADKVSGESGEIKAAMRRSLIKNEALPPRYLDLYAKSHGLNRQDEKLLETLVAGYKALADQIAKAEAAIDEEFEALKKEKGLPAKVPAEADGTIATTFQLLRKPFEHRKWFEQAKITQHFYPLADFQDYTLRNIHEKFRQGLLEFDPNPDWRLGTPTYPDIIAALNHCDIYSWVSPHVFRAMQASASATTPVYETPDKAFVLTSFTSGGKDARRIDILNTSGIHFEKWVNTADLYALSSAIHHKKEHGLPNTNAG
ncbi:hypothetical protein [Candidatus Finniella inopinata]|uniref:hypothetical protein n=1 Tax=Candidatus Finniella inopinata TaxID=1696036 RepID=UPI001A91C0DC|nr:hypothetical protein [Candidatus Finniella inopinata]